MKRVATRSWVILAATLSTLALTADGAAGQETVTLVAGCQIRSLAAYPPGAPLRTITDSIAGEGANPRVWFQVPGSSDFQLYDPRSEERSTKTVLELQDEAAFICLDAQAVWTRPAPPAEAGVRVLGYMQIALDPWSDDSIEYLKPATGLVYLQPGAEVPEIALAGRLELTLDAGDYEMVTFTFLDASLTGSDELIELPLGRKEHPLLLRVPDTNCVSLGAFTVHYLRLPPGSLEKQAAAIDELAEAIDSDDFRQLADEVRRGESVTFLETGSILHRPGPVVLVDEQSIEGAEGCVFVSLHD